MFAPHAFSAGFLTPQDGPQPDPTPTPTPDVEPAPTPSSALLEAERLASHGQVAALSIVTAGQPEAELTDQLEKGSVVAYTVVARATK